MNKENKELGKGEKVEILKSRKVQAGTIGYIVMGPTQFCSRNGVGSYNYKVQAEGKLFWVVEHNVKAVA